MIHYQGFDNEPQVEFLPNGRDVRLLRDLTYWDSKGVPHTARLGLNSDGGSIPPFLWPFIGSPYTKRRRPAYFVHDQECSDLYDYPELEWDGLRLSADTTLREMCVVCGDTEAEARRVVVWVLFFLFF